MPPAFSNEHRRQIALHCWQHLAMAMSHLKQICARQGTVCQQQGLMQVLHGGLLQADTVHAVCATGAASPIVGWWAWAVLL